MSRNALFVAAPFFLMRTPLLPLKEFDQLTRSENPSAHLLNLFGLCPQLREAIAIASPNLYEALQSPDSKEKPETLSSLFRYVVRMATRATPFGLFSFVSFGQWADKTATTFSTSEIKRRARPDMEWLLQVIDQIVSDKNLLPSLSVKSNPLLSESMERFCLSYSREKTKGEEKESVSVQATPLVRYLVEKTSQPIRVSQLLQTLLAEMPMLNPDKVLQVIERLLKEEILITTLYPTLLTDRPFDALLETLHELCPTTFIKLEEIASLIEQYNCYGGDLLFKRLEKAMQELSAASTPLQVDTAYLGDIFLSHKVSEEIARAAETLWKLAFSKKGVAHLRDYHTKFLEKYGTFRTVPLLDLLDEQIGLGIPDAYLSSSTPEQNKEEVDREWEQFLMREWVSCLTHQKEEIILTDEVLDHFSKHMEKQDAPLSFDLYVEIIANSQEALDNGDFLISLHPLTGTGDGGATFGRFLDLFGEREEAKLRDFFVEEEHLAPDELFVECSYFPSSPRSANVAIHPNLRKYAIDLGYGAEETLSLDQILVGATDKHLRLISKETKKELHAVAMNVLNPSSGPTPIRFLREVSKDRYYLFSSFPWGGLEYAPFFPRVRYKKIVLSAARWHITLPLIGATDKESLTEITEKFKKWADQWNLPQRVFMTMMDHRILLDRTLPFHLKEIAHRLKTESKQTIVLTETVGESHWSQSEQGFHRSECVVPFLKNRDYANKPSTPPSDSQVSQKCRWKLPGSEWVYAKLYLKRENEVRFLVQCLGPFVHSIRELIDQWFFVRYQDQEGSHIRLRLKSKKPDLIGEIYSHFHNWTCFLMEKKNIKEVLIGSYEREVERYGGEALIETAENFFAADSLTTLRLLEGLQTKKITLPNYLIATLSVLDMLKGFDISFKEQIALFSSMNLDKKRLEGFREWKSELLAGVQNNYLAEIFETRYAAQRLYASALRDHPEAYQIVSSLLHMNCNRLMGVDLALEQKSYLFASHTLATLSHLLFVSNKS